MDDARTLTLNENRCGGALILPGCKVILEYKDCRCDNVPPDGDDVPNRGYRVRDYDLERIARLLTEGFDCDNLRDFCSFTSGFENLGDKLPKGDRKKPEIVRRIIKFARMRGRIEDVLAWAKRNNPRLYEELEPYQRGVPPLRKEPADEYAV